MWALRSSHQLQEMREYETTTDGRPPKISKGVIVSLCLANRLLIKREDWVDACLLARIGVQKHKIKDQDSFKIAPVKLLRQLEPPVLGRSPSHHVANAMWWDALAVEFGESSESEAEAIEGDDYLPFPKPLSRASFNTPGFQSAEFLSSLSNRHQSLADLQSELRELSQLLNKELLDLVNENYQDFLSLGTALQGGEGKVEEIRTVLLGFQRDVRAVKEIFENKTAQIKELLDTKRRLRTGISVGYDLLDIAERVDLLQRKLMISQSNTEDSGLTEYQEVDDELTGSEDEESDVDELHGQLGRDNLPLVSLKRLERHIQQYVSLKIAIGRVGEHPFVEGQKSRITSIRMALVSDLKNASKLAETATKKEYRLLKILHLYKLLEEQAPESLTSPKSKS
ncbi:hypothetical protein LOZ12_000256 [Ophidiomyces ophidiicola]|uniref:Uncharacterized protein n=1 Tax=Ophidiomyces ophidiicola TaxID=1387563 RepID=A0ACB8V414_9EURO|nr:hypothetical protein LOZ62_001411 [Ophidiomyces ophidiicola]KAI1975407.1 hypothetical protein LOZ56_000606 [Ophidiomyces ophidiicola]KAI2002605.1 hypothetical protein LOZ50_004867 [Ophidiomyces ophidiicola]KAI2026532.1 hypothetical protein LOZ45_002960 [Ophidiomyces ophidiicola]KAI2041608.1 hypothetical protein LOZ47_000432 [Ophidiomyces ophidiicola]